MKIFILAIILVAGYACTPSEKLPGKTSETTQVQSLKGHYNVSDGRVRDHKFSFDLNLNPDGTFTGSYETWIEERITSGGGSLQFFMNEIKGEWKRADSTVSLYMKEKLFIEDLVIDGLKINFYEKEEK